MKKDKKSVSNWRGGCALPPLILSKLAGSIFRSCCRVSSPIYHFFPRHRFISTLRQLTSRKHKDNSLVCLLHFKTTTFENLLLEKQAFFIFDDFESCWSFVSQQLSRSYSSCKPSLFKAQCQCYLNSPEPLNN